MDNVNCDSCKGTGRVVVGEVDFAPITAPCQVCRIPYLRMGEKTKKTEKEELWDAISDYVKSCGGDPSFNIYGNVTRQKAVNKIENIVFGNGPLGRLNEAKMKISHDIDRLQDEAGGDHEVDFEIGGLQRALDILEEFS